MKELFEQVVSELGLLDDEQVGLVWRFHVFEGRKRHPADVAVSLGLLDENQARQLTSAVTTSRSEMRARGETRSVDSGDWRPPDAPDAPLHSNVRQSGKKPAQAGVVKPARRAEPRAPAVKPAKRAKQLAPGELLDRLVHRAVDAGASDLHIHSGVEPFMRVAGRIEGGMAAVVGQREIVDELSDVLDDKHWTLVKTVGHADLCVTYRGGYRLRMNVFRALRGVSVSIRLIPPEVPTLDELNIPEAVTNLTRYYEGLVLLVGPTSGGKSTTMASLVQHINQRRKVHIVTIEEPIEYVYTPDKAAVTQRYVGVHTKSYASALQAALREDPDVIAIGEMRDEETIRIALTAAETGHLVFGTMHTFTVEATISRILDAFGDAEAEVRGMLAESLRGILVQQLVHTTTGGLHPVVELMFNNPAIAHNIRQRKLHQIPSAIHSGRGQGMIPFEQSIAQLLKRGLITPEEAALVKDEVRRGAIG